MPFEADRRADVLLHSGPSVTVSLSSVGGLSGRALQESRLEVNTACIERGHVTDRES